MKLWLIYFITLAPACENTAMCNIIKHKDKKVMT